MYEDFTTLTQVSPVLTNDALSEALSKWFAENVKFTHWEYVSETGKGDSYLSELIRIKIHGVTQSDTSKHVQVILKNIPKSVSRRITYRCDEVFKNEINFYTKVLPQLLEFQSTKEIKEPFNKYAKLFYSYTDGVNDVLCLEDASLEGFSTAVRQDGVDLEHCKLSFKALAQYHAMSFAMKDQNPTEFQEISDQIFEVYYDDRLWDWYGRFWKRIFNIAIDAVEKEYPNTIYVEKIKEFSHPSRYKDMVAAATGTKDTGVISHGDCWTNNFLYRYVAEKPLDVKLIDFQLTRCASPVLDVTFFIYACTTKSLRDDHYDALLDYYYEVLSNQIGEMGSDPEKVYPKTVFLDEVKKYSYFGLAFSFESTPFIVLAPEDAINMDMEGDKKVNIDDIWQLKPFKTKEGRLREANNVVHAVDRGLWPQFKYLGHVITDCLADDQDIDRERRALAARCNMIAHRFARCSKEVKLTLFRAYCQSFYTCSLWVRYTQKAYNALRVQYNNALRMMLGMLRRCSASAMFAEARVDDFYAILRKRSASMWMRFRGGSNTINALSNKYDGPFVRHWAGVFVRHGVHTPN